MFTAARKALWTPHPRVVAAAGSALAWDAASIIDGVDITGSGLVATRNSTSAGAQRTFWVNTKFPDASKTYFAIVGSAFPNDANVAMGPTNNSQNRSGSPGLGGTGSNSVAYVGGAGVTGNQIYFNNSSTGTEFGTEFKSKETLVCFDGPNRKFYFYNPGYGWGGVNGTSDDPLTNDGGWQCTGSGPLGDMYLGVQLLTAGDAFTIRTSSFTNTTQVSALNSAGWSVLS